MYKYISPHAYVSNVDMFTCAKEDMFLAVFVCLSVCLQNNSKSYEWILMKLTGNVTGSFITMSSVFVYIIYCQIAWQKNARHTHKSVYNIPKFHLDFA